MTALDQLSPQVSAAEWRGVSTYSGRRPRVVIGIPCLLIGGTEVHTLALATALRSAGFDVSVCCYHEFDAGMVETFRDRGIEVELLDLRRASARISVGGVSALARSFAKLLTRRRPDIAHIQYMTPGAFPVAIARAVGVPRVVATVHVAAEHYGRRLWFPRHVVARACDAFLCVSKTAEVGFFGGAPELFSSQSWRLGRRHFTIHNCVDLNGIDRSGGTEFAPANGPVIGIIGRLHPLKGHDILLDAMARVVRRFPKASLLCVGDGEQRGALIRQAESLGITQHVKWIGNVRPEAVSTYVRQMDVVAMPSRLEGFGLAAAEAMAHSKPIVASSIDGLVEVIGRTGDADGCGGLVVAPGDSEALAAGVEHLLDHPAERAALGAAGRRRVEKLFSTDAFAARHIDLYTALLRVRS